MKNLFKSLMMLGFFAAMFSACQKEDANDGATPSVHFTINADVAASRTAITDNGDGTYTPSWQKNDQLAVFFGFPVENMTPTTFENTANDGTTASFEATVNDVKDEQTLYAFYPQSAFARNYNSNSTTGLNLSTTQQPSLNSFDPAADILVAKPKTVTVSGTDVTINDMAFARMISVAKVVLNDATGGQLADEKVLSVKIAVSDSYDLAGRMRVDMNTAKIIDYTTYDHEVIAKYDVEDNFVINGTNAAYLCVFPTVVPAGETVEFLIETENYEITKSVTLSSDLAFPISNVAKITLNIQESELEEKVAGTLADGTYVIVATNTNKTAFYAMSGANEGTGSSAQKRRAYVDVTSDFDATAASYMTDNDALKWEIAATTGGYTISQDGKYLTCDSGNSYALMGTEPYLLTITAQNDGIYQISSAAATNRILAKNQNSAYGFAFYTGSGYTDIYIVPVAADTRTALATPTVTATAEEQTITVSWNEVANAGSYEVTCGTKEQTINAPTTTCIFEDLNPNEEYAISVVAKPSDTSLYKDSAAGTTTATTDEAEVSQDDKVLTFEFTQAKNAGWPTSYDAAIATESQPYNNGEYIFTTTRGTAQKAGIYQNSSYLMLYANEFLGLPIVEGYKLTTVVTSANGSGTPSTSVQVGIRDAASTDGNIVAAYQTWSTKGIDYIYTISNPAVNTRYYISITTKNAQMTKLVLTYEK